MEADFSYTIESAKQHQKVTGTLRLMKPNLARVTFKSIARPAYPNLIASDGKTRYSFTSSQFHGALPPVPTNYDPIAEAKEASGLFVGGGKITTNIVEPDGSNLHLWDSVAPQAFFGPENAIRSYAYVRNLDDLGYIGTEKVDGVTYRVLFHRLSQGNIAGGETTPFDQKLYIGPDNLIHMYVLRFTSNGKPGVQTMKLTNIKLNQPMKESDFAFTPPTETKNKAVERSTK